MKSSEARPSCGHAFTLTELLLTVAIICILASLILSSVVGGKRKADRVRCASNLRQLFLGMHQFVEDYHVYPLYANLGLLPHGEYPEHSVDWMHAVQREGIAEVSIGSTNWRTNGVWRCPAAKWRSGYDLFPLDYGYNCAGLGLYSDGISFCLGRHYAENG